MKKLLIEKEYNNNINYFQPIHFKFFNFYNILH
jgi:hypothetical protein